MNTYHTPAAGSIARPLVVRLVPVLDFGGVESRIVLQATLAAERFYDLRICTFAAAGRAAERVREQGVAVDVLDTRASLRSIKPTHVLTRYLRTLRPTIVHSSISEANVHSLLGSSIARVPVRITEEVGVPNHSVRARMVMACMYRLASRVVGVTEATCDYLVNVDHVPRSLVRRVYNCANPAFFPAQRAAPRERAGQPHQFLVVGRLHEVKNHLRLLEAFAHVIAVEPTARMVIAGDGPLEAATRERIAALGLATSVAMLGFRSDIAELLRMADTFVLPSLSEGCSISLIEAMAAGVPAIGSDIPGIHEVLGPVLGNEWTFPPTNVTAMAETMLRMIRLDDGERCEVAARSQERAYREFSPTAYMDNLDALYKEAIASSTVQLRIALRANQRDET